MRTGLFMSSDAGKTARQELAAITDIPLKAQFVYNITVAGEQTGSS